MQHFLLNHGVSASTRTDMSFKYNPAGRTALFRLIFDDNLPLFKSLVAAGVDVNVADIKGTTPLMRAAAAGNLPMIKALLDAKANVNAEDKKGRTALCYSQSYLFNPHSDAVSALLVFNGGYCRD